MLVAVMGMGCASTPPTPNGQTSNDYQQITQGDIIAKINYTGTVREISTWDRIGIFGGGPNGYKVVTDERTLYFVDSGLVSYDGSPPFYAPEDNKVLIKNQGQGKNLTIGNSYEWTIYAYSESPYYALASVTPIKTES